MHNKRLLVSWIGHADLAAMANERPEPDRRRILAALKSRPNPDLRTGPIRTLIEAERFDRIHLLSNYQQLLRVLQPPAGTGPCHRVFRRVGETRDHTSNVRVIAATNRDLLREVDAHRFREDLYYRLAVITLQIPPLRERKSDLPLLIEAFLIQINRDFAAQEPGYRNKSISAAANAFVRRYAWPGNVRQLFNALVQSAAMSAGDCIQQADLEAALGVSARPQDDPLDRPLGDGFSLEDHLKEIQRHYLRRAMEESGGVKTRAAELLGIPNYQTLDAQLKRLDVKWTK